MSDHYRNTCPVCDNVSQCKCKDCIQVESTDLCHRCKEDIYGEDDLDRLVGALENNTSLEFQENLMELGNAVRLFENMTDVHMLASHEHLDLAAFETLGGIEFINNIPGMKLEGTELSQELLDGAAGFLLDKTGDFLTRIWKMIKRLFNWIVDMILGEKAIREARIMSRFLDKAIRWMAVKDVPHFRADVANFGEVNNQTQACSLVVGGYLVEMANKVQQPDFFNTRMNHLRKTLSTSREHETFKRIRMDQEGLITYIPIETRPQDVVAAGWADTAKMMEASMKFTTFLEDYCTKGFSKRLANLKNQMNDMVTHMHDNPSGSADVAKNIYIIMANYGKAADEVRAMQKMTTATVKMVVDTIR